MALLLLTSLSITYLTKQHILVINSQKLGISYTKDDTTSWDWAQGAHKSYGAHTMLKGIVEHKASLHGVKYDAYESGLRQTVVFKKGVLSILPESMSHMVDEDSRLIIEALNRGEFVIELITIEGKILGAQYN